MPAKKRQRVAKRAAAPEKPKRTHTRGVRERILKLLASGDMTRAELLQKGRFSKAALFMREKELIKEGLVETDEDNRILHLKRSPGHTPEVPAPTQDKLPTVIETPRRRAVIKEQHVPRELHEAIEVLRARFAPIADVDHKVLVLEELIKATPAPIAKVLKALLDDVLQRADGLTE